MSAQIIKAKPREIGDEIPEPKINPLDLKEIAINLKNAKEIFSTVDDSIKEFINKIIENTELMFN
jgi:hypothetical protein